MTETSPLDRLAARWGIEPSYVDAWGRRRHVDPDSQRALLRALGVPADSDGEIADSLAHEEALRRARILRPASVLADGGAATVGVATGGGGPPQRVAWRVLLEGGGVERGIVTWDAMAPEPEPNAGLAGEVRSLRLPADLPHGYHRLHVALGPGGGREAEAALIRAPAACRALPGDRRLWGLAVQLYGAVSGRSWGIGDFADLARTARLAAGLGADAVGISPVHALFPADPGHFGPYGPSDRAFLNVMHIAVEQVPEFAGSPAARKLASRPAFREALASARAADLIDYPAAARLKLPALEALHESFRERAPADAYHAFKAEGGGALDRHATFEALHEHFFKGPSAAWDWRAWPAPYRDAAGSEVRRFREEHAERVDFFAWLQWLADEQLAAAQQEACAAGMALGLYRDLAVGIHPGGSAAWSRPDVVPTGAAIGAPPDDFNPKGQNWGLAALSPRALVEAGYEPLARLFRANMRHAGALRIDHVMALQRLFWIPEGADATAGAYVRYPLADQLGVLALESERAGCVVVGEDLGTVAEDFRRATDAAGVLSYRVLYFERDEEGGFAPPSAYPARALVTATTHDLPTLRGWWGERDLDWRERLDLYRDPEAAAVARADRARDRAALLERLRAEGTIGGGEPDEEELVEAV